MTVEPLAVWSLYPDWADGVTETLEFLTTIAASPLALEQRRGIRLSPRQSFEYSYVLAGPDRTHFDLLTMRSAGSPIYLPLWHDVELLQTATERGDTVLQVDTTHTEIRQVQWVFIGGNNDYEIGEISAWSDNDITVNTGLVNNWPKGTRIVPLKKCKVDQQPSTTRRADHVHVARVRFISLEKNLTDAPSPFNTFGSQYVLEDDPNEVDDFSYNYERVMSVLDNTMGKQHLFDVTGRILQQFAWWAKGREAHRRLRGMFYALDGRRMPLWVPTLYADFEPVEAIHINDAKIDVKRCGFTELGGPVPNREYILIHTRSGDRYYRKIVNSVVLGDGTAERLILDTWLDVELPLSQIKRISFLVLSRMDQDSVEFTHHTATRGMTTAVAVFRSAAGYDGIELTQEVPPTTVIGAVCVNEVPFYVQTFDYSSLYGNHDVYNQPRRLDQFGNFYFSPDHYHVDVYGPQGVLLRTTTNVDIINAIDAWHGGPIFPRVLDNWAANSTMYTCPLRQGRYVLVMIRASRNPFQTDKWWVLTEPTPGGSLNIVGAVWNYTNAIFTPNAFGYNLLEVHNDDSIILIDAQYSITYIDTALIALPSISEFRDNTYATGWLASGATPLPHQISFAGLYPIGNTYNLSTNLYNGGHSFESGNYGCRLPGNGREILYIYMSRGFVQDANTVGLFFPDEVEIVIYPLYPNGVMLKIPLGDVSSYQELALILPTDQPGGVWIRGRGTEDYSFDNENWQKSNGAPAIPFLEEYTQLSGGAVAVTDTYSPQISTQLRSNGHYWVIFVMAGIEDSYPWRTTSSGPPGAPVYEWGSPVYGIVRIFDYDPATEVAVEIVEQQCTLISHEDVTPLQRQQPATVQSLAKITAEIVETDGIALCVLHGMLFKIDFCRFEIPE